MSLIEQIRRAQVAAGEEVVLRDLRDKGLAPALTVNEDGTIHGLTAQIVTWADKRFPNRTPDKAFLKMFEEMGELVADPSSPGEYADVLIMLFDLADMHGVDAAKAIRDKLAILEERTEWKANELGVFQHVEEINESPKSEEARRGSPMPIPVVISVRPGQTFQLLEEGPICGRKLSNGEECIRPADSWCEACL